MPELCGLCYQSSGGSVRFGTVRSGPVRFGCVRRSRCVSGGVFRCVRTCLWCFPEFRWHSVSVPVVLQWWSPSPKLFPCVADGQPVLLYDAGRPVIRWRSSSPQSFASGSRRRRDAVLGLLLTPPPVLGIFEYILWCVWCLLCCCNFDTLAERASDFNLRDCLSGKQIKVPTCE